MTGSQLPKSVYVRSTERGLIATELCLDYDARRYVLAEPTDEMVERLTEHLHARGGHLARREAAEARARDYLAAAFGTEVHDG